MKIDKSWYIKPKSKNFPSDVSAGGVIIRIEGNKLLTALIRNPEFDDYLLPKGRVEKGESLENAAKREIAEETGLSKLKLIGKLGIKNRLTFEKDEWRTTHYFLFLTKQKKGTQNLQVNENYVLKWYPIDDLPPMFWSEQRELIEENRKKIKRLVRGF